MKEFGSNGDYSERSQHPLSGAETAAYMMHHNPEGPQSEIAPPTADYIPQEELSVPQVAVRPEIEPVQTSAYSEKLSPFELAEKLDITALRRQAGKLGLPRQIPKLATLASVLTEIGLASPFKVEAQQAFARADKLYSAVLQRTNPSSETWLRAHRAACFLPVMRMRRDGIEPEIVSAAAYRALGQSLRVVSQRMEEVMEEAGLPKRYMPAYLFGLFAEDSVPALLARDGVAPYISSEREGVSSPAGGALRQASDFHYIEGDAKVSVEVKYAADNFPGRPYDDDKIVVVKYLPDVCGPLGEEWGLGKEGIAVPRARVARQLAQLLVSESTGAWQPSSPRDRFFLNRGTELVKEKIGLWQREKAEKGGV